MMEKTLYRKLIKRFHPDTTTCPKKKVVYEELTKRINHAFDIGDIAELIAIDCEGEPFASNNKTTSKPPKAKTSAPHSTDSPRPSYSSPKPPKAAMYGLLTGFTEVAKALLYFLLNPYGIALAMKTWDENGRCRNLLSLMGGIFWMMIAVSVWKQIGIQAQLHGISHESLAGLGIVGLRAILILGSLPIILCLAHFGIFTGVILGVCGLLCAIMMKVFGLFHPLLAWVPLIIYIIFAIRFIWHVLANSFSIQEKNS